MSSFTTPLDLCANDDGRTFKLLTEFDYEIGELGSGNVIRVPAGFVTDFASVPQVFWNIFPPWGKYGKAAVLHDWLYSIQDRKRSECDSILLEAMQALGVSWITRHTIYSAVRLGGWLAWNGHTRENKEKKSCGKQ